MILTRKPIDRSRSPSQAQAGLVLNSVQILRAAAAALVVIFHAFALWREGVGPGGDTLFMGPWDRGYAGVDLFFVISGFIMVWVTQERAGRPREAAQFAYARVTRIFPLWWVFCAGMGAYFWLTYGQPASPALVAPHEAYGVFVRSMALWPQRLQPVLTVGWTLIYELAFYAIFAVLMLLRRQWRMPLIGLWGVILIGLIIMPVIMPVAAPSAASSLIPSSASLPASWVRVWLSPLCLEFVMGAGVAWAVLRWPRRLKSPVTALTILSLGVIGLCLGLFGINLMGVSETGSAAMGGASLSLARLSQFGLPSALILMGLVRLERSDYSFNWRLGIYMGNASYALYLSHLLTLLIWRKVWELSGVGMTPNAMNAAIFTVLGTGLSLVAAHFVYRWIEAPLLRLTRRFRPAASG